MKRAVLALTTVLATLLALEILHAARESDSAPTSKQAQTEATDRPNGYQAEIAERRALTDSLRRLVELQAFQQELAHGEVDFDRRDPSRGIEPPTAADPD